MTSILYRWIEGLGSEEAGAAIGGYVQFYTLSFLELYASRQIILGDKLSMQIFLLGWPIMTDQGHL